MEVKKRHYSILSIALLLIVGSIFTALGIALAIITLDGIFKYGIAQIGVGIIMPIVLISALLGFGTSALVMGGKQIYLWIRERKAKKYGRDATAQIVDFKSASFGKRTNTRIRYAFVLTYTDGEENKKFTTDYLYDINEFKYLKGLESLKIKVDGNFVTISESFPREIYKLDSTYGIEIAFYKQKPVAVLIRLWSVCFLIVLAFFIVSIIIGNGVVTKVAIILLFAVHFPFAIPLAFYLIKWFNRKK